MTVDTETRADPGAATLPPLRVRFDAIRARTIALVDGLSAEDLVAQSMPDASPAKWHLAHTTWFFDALVLGTRGQPRVRPEWGVLLNSYYDALGAKHPRPERGLLTRPSLAEVLAYRRDVDAAMREALRGELDSARLELVELGLQHEQQHQELIVTDLLHLFSRNPLGPALRASPAPASRETPLEWIEHADEGVAEIGAGEHGFAFDNERPRHRVWLSPFALASRPVTNAEFLAFVEADDYRDPQWWLSDGFARATEENWRMPLYWRRDERGGVEQFGVAGWRALDPNAPAVHLSYYEADAYARFVGARLPTEFEWEAIAQSHPPLGGDVWEWTSSAYSPYPGFRPFAGIAAEYNGKFMSGQMVLRGGSWATPRDHIRTSYRNFFPPHARWQFSGLRLARTLGRDRA
jgi:ergothioneine biosynthesis protein EgtB